ncbi:transglycosylase SLT domain-containing protein [Agrobacterium vitis]|uniref:transglycosylase SLT domain-containing protein n=1 Tax=Agrobacterium vitis TaxID=373 RepID=UPI002034B2CF|nr:transglycosylase SLT domain-containing protein [Agrobacterium vitis]MCM2452946.1 transglycosylase SLT domain-containing protein [Agrobacterium vitis]
MAVRIPTSADISQGGYNSGRSNGGGVSVNVGQGLAAAGQAVQDVAGAAYQSQQQDQAFLAQAKFAEWQQGLNKQVEDARRNAAADGTGITQTFGKPLEKEADDFAEKNFAGLGRRQQEIMAQRMQQAVYGVQDRAQVYETQARDTFSTKTASDGLDAFKSGVGNGSLDYDTARRQGEDLINTAPLPPEQRTVLLDKWKPTLAETYAQRRFQSNPQGTIEALRGVDQNDAFARATEWAESRGKADAESSKGASGLMQVMPATGGDIAKAVGDKNFPIDGTEEQQKAYLKNPDVSRTYGRYYLNQQLQKFDGDYAAAAVAYNAGPSVADKWIASGKDDSVLPAETRAYKAKVLGNMANATITTEDVRTAKASLLSRTDKGPEAIDGLNDGFAVKLNRMIDGAPEDVKKGLGLFSAYRPPERQAQIISESMGKYGFNADDQSAWQRDVQSLGPQAAGEKWADRFKSSGMSQWVAKPGYSQHQKGDAADLSWNGQSLAKAPQAVKDWVRANAGDFGLSVPLSNEDWHIEDADARAGKPVKVASADRRFNDLDPDKRYALALNYQNQYHQQVAQQKATQQDDWQLRIAQDPASVNPQSIVADSLLDGGQKAALLNTLRENRDKLFGQTQVAAVMAGTGDVLNPEDEKIRKGVDGFYNQAMTNAGNNGQQRTAMERDIVTRTGVVPTPVKDRVTMGLAMNDANSAVNALNTMAFVRQSAPAGYAQAFNDRQQKDFELYDHYRSAGFSDAMAAQRVVDSRDPARASQRKTIVDSFSKDLKKLDASDFTSALKGVEGWWSRPGTQGDQASELASMNIPVVANAILASDYRTFVEDRLVENGGDMDAAKKTAVNDMKRAGWAVSTLVPGGNVLVKNPPEAHYPADTDGKWDWIKDQAKEGLAGAGVKTDTVFLQPDVQTAEELRRGGQPTYRVYFKDKNGAYQVFGQRFVPDLVSEKARQMKAKADMAAKGEQQWQQNRVRDQGITDMLNAPGAASDVGMSPMSQAAVDRSRQELDGIAQGSSVDLLGSMREYMNSMFGAQQFENADIPKSGRVGAQQFENADIPKSGRVGNKKRSRYAFGGPIPKDGKS